MDFWQIIVAVLSGALLVGGIAAGLYVGFTKQTRKEDREDQAEELTTIRLLKEQIAALDAKVNDQDRHIATLSEQVTSLKTLIEEKDRKLREYLQILQGRNPEISEVLHKMREYMETNQPIFEKLNEYLDNKI